MKTIIVSLSIIIGILVLSGCSVQNTPKPIAIETPTTKKIEPIEKIKTMKLGDVTQLDPDKLPKEIQHKGDIKNAVHFIDSLGENIVITAETGIYPQYSGDSGQMVNRNKELFGYRFVRPENSQEPFHQVWRVYDYTHECPLAIEANFIGNTFQITDLDQNGVAEIWLMYKTLCRSDVSPATMKIIMYENSQKFAMRGRSRVKTSKTTFDGGNYTYDKAFMNGSKEFLDFAKNLWDKNFMEETW